MKLSRCLLCLCVIQLSACIAPVELIEESEKEQLPAQSLRDVVKEQAISEYACTEKKTVRVQRAENKKNATVTVMFDNTSYNLSPTVSDEGKKYSNIRWIWFEKSNGKAVLSDNRHNILAKNCVKKEESQ